MNDTFKTPLGEMNIIEYYLYYDRPFIFLCEDSVEGKFIVHLIDDDEFCEKWFLVPSTNRRVEYVRTGKISLRESILKAEPGWVWEITTPFDGSNGLCLKKECLTIEEIDLPNECAILSLAERNLPELKTEPETEARQTARNVLFISIDNGSHSQTISVNDYGSILLRSQGLIHALALSGAASARGRIPLATIENTTLNYIGNFAASIGIKLEAKNGKLFDPDLEQAIESMLSLMDTSTDKEKLISILKKIPYRATARYKFLLQALDQGELSLKADWGSPHKGRRTAYMSHSQIREVIDLLELDGDDVSQSIELNGDLLGLVINKKNKRGTFQFLPSDGERIIKGALSQELFDIVDREHIELPQYGISVILEETIEINPSTGEESTSYEMIKIFSKPSK